MFIQTKSALELWFSRNVAFVKGPLKPGKTSTWCCISVGHLTCLLFSVRLAGQGERGWGEQSVGTIWLSVQGTGRSVLWFDQINTHMASISWLKGAETTEWRRASVCKRLSGRWPSEGNDWVRANSLRTLAIIGNYCKSQYFSDCFKNTHNFLFR